MGKIGFILHGKTKGKRKLLTQLKAQFEPNHQLAIYETQHENHAAELTQQALIAHCDYIIAVGGDGTLNEVVNGYMSAGKDLKMNRCLGVLPWGTGNDFVRSLGIDRSTEQLYKLIDSKAVSEIDIGVMEFEHAEDKKYTRYFDNIADLGIGAEVVARVNGVHLRKRILGGTLVFFFTALRTFFTYKHKQITVIGDDFKWSGSILALVVANGRFFGSGLGIAPDAKINDGSFEVVIFGDLSVIDYLKHYGKIRKSKKLNLDEVNYLRTKALQIETDLSDVAVEADGEVSGTAPVTMRCLHRALPFLTPPASL